VKGVGRVLSAIYPCSKIDTCPRIFIVAATTPSRDRSFVITALVSLFVIGTIASLVSVVSLTFPGSFLDPIWQLNPRAHEHFIRLGGWAIVLMSVVCIACAGTALGLHLRQNWGYWLAVGMLGANLVGDLINLIIGHERKAIVGVPIALLVLTYLLRKAVRRLFHN